MLIDSLHVRLILSALIHSLPTSQSSSRQLSPDDSPPPTLFPDYSTPVPSLLTIRTRKEEMTSIEIHGRDYAADMRKLIDEYRNNSTYNAGVIAHEIVQRLLREDRNLLLGWLEGHAIMTIRAAVTAADASTRSYARTRTVASVFAEAAAEAEAGNPKPLQQGFLQAVYVINTDNTRKALKDMTSDDVLFVVASYEDRAKSSAMEAAFLRAVAKKIGNGRVGDHFTNIDLAELRGQVTGRSI